MITGAELEFSFSHAEGRYVTTGVGEGVLSAASVVMSVVPTMTMPLPSSPSLHSAAFNINSPRVGVGRTVVASLSKTPVELDFQSERSRAFRLASTSSSSLSFSPPSLPTAIAFIVGVNGGGAVSSFVGIMNNDTIATTKTTTSTALSPRDLYTRLPKSPLPRISPISFRALNHPLPLPLPIVLEIQSTRSPLGRGVAAAVSYSSLSFAARAAALTSSSTCANNSTRTSVAGGRRSSVASSLGGGGKGATATALLLTTPGRTAEGGSGATDVEVTFRQRGESSDKGQFRGQSLDKGRSRIKSLDKGRSRVESLDKGLSKNVLEILNLKGRLYKTQNSSESSLPLPLPLPLPLLSQAGPQPPLNPSPLPTLPFLFLPPPPSLPQPPPLPFSPPPPPHPHRQYHQRPSGTA